MKKTLLFSLIACMASMSVAQSVRATAPQLEKHLVKTEMAKKAMIASSSALSAEQLSNGPRKTAKNGVYYTKPEGSMWAGYSKEGYGYYYGINVLSPAVDNVFVNMCTKSNSAVWSINGNTYDGDSINNFHYGTLPMGGGYYVPTITVGKTSWSLDELSENLSDGYGTMLITDSIGSHTFSAPNCAGYGFGAFDTGYLYGNGIVTFSDGSSYPGYGVSQDYPKPASPLYVEDIHAIVYTDGTAPIQGDAVLPMYITQDTTLIAELTATAADVSDVLYEGSVQYTKTGKVAMYIITFSQKVVDDFGTEIASPFVLDSAFTVTITGFMNEGINAGFRGNDEIGEDTPVGASARPLIYSEEDDAVYSFGYSLDEGENLVLDLCFNSCFDYVDVVTELTNTQTEEVYTGCNVLVVSADGETVYNQGVGAESDMNFVFVNHAFEWISNDANNYIEVEDLPEWLEVIYESEYDEEGAYTGTTYVGVVCEPLPEGETGRTATITYTGKGYTAPNSIVVIQGEGATGLEKVATVSEDVVYNVYGQRVNNANGFVIKNGVKTIMK